jgi:hypothetical protein
MISRMRDLPTRILYTNDKIRAISSVELALKVFLNSPMMK